MTICHICDSQFSGRQQHYCSPTCANRAFSIRRIADGRLAEQRIKHRVKRAMGAKVQYQRSMETRTWPRAAPPSNGTSPKLSEPPAMMT